TADADLSTLLTKASEKITAGDRLVIVVDALDEVDQESTGNLLYLPTILPERVYFLLTRRPSNQNEKRLNVSPSVPTQELDLRDYADRSSQDVKEYIWLLLNESENNFMYLHHTLNAIAEGFDSQWQFDCILPGLEAYYQQHWQKMKGEALSDLLLKVVGVLTCAETGEISAKGIAQAISQRLDATRTAEDEYDVEEILENWLEFLHQHRIGKETRYSFYHSHFRLWLANQTGIC
ncbi:MAG: hypothetical protein ACREPR_18130, partial [Brasilonema sp.]